MSRKNFCSFSLCSTFPAIFLYFMVFSPLAHAGDLSGRWSIGLESGVNKLTEGYWDYSNLDQFGGIIVGRNLTPHWNGQFALRFSQFRPGVDAREGEAGWDFYSGAPLYTTLWQPSAQVQYRFAPYSRFCPTMGVGMGFASWKVLDLTGEEPGLFPSGDPVQGYDVNGEIKELKGSNFTISLELGLDIFITDSIALNLGGRYHLLPGNEIDNVGTSFLWGPDHVDANTAMAQGYVGLTMWFGNTDWDEDGIKNKYDLCPTAAEDFDGFMDEDGCPEIDNDGDKIIDRKDDCPNEPEDMDGFQDLDGCPDPDNDGDGVLDGDDLCPNTPMGLDVDKNGCVKEVVPVQPEEQTPPPAPSATTPAPVAVPVVAAPPVAKVVYADDSNAIQGVSFKSGSAELTPESIAILAELAVDLRAVPDGRFEIRGHTDSQGDDEANRDLSMLRAISVRNSLIQMGVAPIRLTAVGYGEDFPVESNATRKGRSRNRRVELHQIN